MAHSARETLSSRYVRNAVIFGRILRRHGLGAQPDRILLFARALAAIGVERRDDVRETARTIFVRHVEQRDAFERVFDAFWHLLAHPAPRPESRLGRASRESDATGRTQGAPDAGLCSIRAAEIPHHASRGSESTTAAAPAVAGILAPGGDRSFTYSFAEALGARDFSQLSGAELAMALELTKYRQLRLGLRRSRRTVAGRGVLVDLRRTLRAGLARYGEVVSIVRRAPAVRQRDLVLLCDVSGSMDRYARLLLQFMHAMRHALGRVEAFVFGTRLTRITRDLRQRDVGQALDRVAARVQDWGGGTRIGECLREFNLRWARRVLARGATVIVMSDGWDRGDLELLACEMRRLQRSSYRLIWLNPLAGAAAYRPQTLGMQAALPFIDDFLPAHNLHSLAQVVLALRSVDRRRPVRSQAPGLRAVAPHGAHAGPTRGG